MLRVVTAFGLKDRLGERFFSFDVAKLAWFVAKVGIPPLSQDRHGH